MISTEPVLPDFKKCAEYIHDQRGKVFSGSIEKSRIAEIAWALKILFEHGYALGRQLEQLKKGEME